MSTKKITKKERMDYIVNFALHGTVDKEEHVRMYNECRKKNIEFCATSKYDAYWSASIPESVSIDKDQLFEGTTIKTSIRKGYTNIYGPACFMYLDPFTEMIYNATCK